MLKTLAIKINSFRLNQKQIAKELVYSDSIIDRHRDEVIMKNPFNRNISKRKKMSLQRPSVNWSRVSKGNC